MLAEAFEPSSSELPPVLSIPTTRPEEPDAEEPYKGLSAEEDAGMGPSSRLEKRVRSVCIGMVLLVVLGLIVFFITRGRHSAPPGAGVAAPVPEESIASSETIGETEPVAESPMKPRFGIPPPPASLEAATEPRTASVRAEPGAAQPEGWISEARKLRIAKAVLSRNVTGFARYEPLTEARLRARHLPLVQLYVEFEAPQPEVREDGRHVYRLAQDIRMVRGDSGRGAPLIENTVSLTEVAMGPKRDFFASQYLRPARPAEPGDYVIEVRLTDQVANITAAAKIPVTIVAE